jgi:dGTPase
MVLTRTKSKYSIAKYATDENKSKGRYYKEINEDNKYRSVFGRDRDRIINSSSFRRLQYKTQVFVNHQGDHYRTRLTHSLEMAQIARWIAGALNINKDLAEIVSLAHDLGHTPFGHAGEESLNNKMQNYGGFSHNAHTLKLITKIEKVFIGMDGLNLSWEMLEGVVKHNGPIINKTNSNNYIFEYNQIYNLELGHFSSLEAQVSAISDDIAYNNHDIEDGLRAGLFEIEALFSIPLIGDIYQEILGKNKNINRELLVAEAKRKITLKMVIDVIENTKDNIKNFKIKSVDDVRKFNRSIVNFSDFMQDVHIKTKEFLMNNMYRHSVVNQMTNDAKNIVATLFDFFTQNTDHLPKEERAIVNEGDKKLLADTVSDYIAGMTDRFAIKQYQQIIK